MDYRKKAFDGLFGLEKENLRVDNLGRLSLKKHPRIFGKTNPYITRDFSEAQIEMITSPHVSIEGAYNELHNIQHVVLDSLEDEFLWPQSNPAILPLTEGIPIADFDDSEKRKYREYLTERYDNKRSVISGIHFNASFTESYLKEIFENSKSNNFVNFKNEMYLKIAKYFIKNQWLFTRLFAASPVFHETYVSQCVGKTLVNGKGDCSKSGLHSLRNSECGYTNNQPIFLDYTNIDSFNTRIKSLVQNKQIYDESEIYVPVRIKKDTSNNIEYLEFRFIDINPLFFNGVSKADLELIHMFFVYYSTLSDFTLTQDLQIESNYKNMAINSMSEDYHVKFDSEGLKREGIESLKDLQNFMNDILDAPYEYESNINSAIGRLQNEEESYSEKIRNRIRTSSYLAYHMDIAKKQTQYVAENPLTLKGLENLELSTRILIQSCIKLGKNFEILDYNENFLKIKDPTTGVSEYVKQATKTSLDNYSSVLVMENKAVTKKILSDHGLQVPTGFIINDINQGIELSKYNHISKEGIVIKPNNTNFGLGITILENKYSEKEYLKALSFAFKYDNTVLIESFIKGNEFRFLVVDGKVSGVLHRRSANIVGDGKKSIEQLISIKNEDPLRGIGYKTPLEIIQVDEVVIDFLNRQNYSLDDVVKEDKRVYLRENSNISTGGDSIDCTDKIHQSYFSEALKAVQSLNVSISGVDMMISDVSMPADTTNHSIIELNFNPAIHIHCFPFEGPRRYIGDDIVSALFK